MDLLRDRASQLAAESRSCRPVFVANEPALIELTDRLGQVDVVGLDTEFVRESTFTPSLALLQLSLPEHHNQYLIDAPAIGGIDGMFELLINPSLVKVMHGCSEDLEIFLHQHGALPASVFDTQIAASLLGARIQSGYNTLVSGLFGIEVDKTQTRSDWFQRPLSEKQLGYAATDVLYLLPLYAILNSVLIEIGRKQWLEDEIEQLLYNVQHPQKPELYYQKISNHWRLPPKALYLLQQLCLWREQEARRQNLPRGFIVCDSALPDIVKRTSLTMHSLRQIKAIKPAQLHKHGPGLLDCLQSARDKMPADAGQNLSVKKPLPKIYQPIIKRLKACVAKRAEQLQIDPSLLLGKRYMLQFFDQALKQFEATGRVTLDTMTQQPWQQGWRRREILELLVDPFISSISEIEILS